MMETVKITYVANSYPTERITSIKALRSLFGLGLKEAKDILDQAYEHPHTTFEISNHGNDVTHIPEQDVARHLSVLEENHVITSINSVFNDVRMQLIEIIKESTDSGYFGLASDIASVCEKHFRGAVKSPESI